MIDNMWGLSFYGLVTSLRVIFPTNGHSPANFIINERIKKIKIKGFHISKPVSVTIVLVLKEEY